MRIYELNPILDSDILGSQVLALDDSTQTRKISLDQIRVFLGVGENSTLIPSGTDIHAYFLTAKSGSYYGEGLVNTALVGAWAAFDWSTHEDGRGTLIENNNTSEMGVHSLAAGAWTRKKIMSEWGGTFVDRVIFNRDADCIRMKNTTQGKPIYMICQDADGTNRFYLGIGEDGTSNASLYNYIGGGNRVTVSDNGSILLIPRGGASVVAHDFLVANGDGSSLRLKNKTQGKALILLAQDADGTNRWYLGNGGDANNGIALANYKAAGGVNSLTLSADGQVSLSNFGGNIVLNVDGSTALSDYKHFDAHYDARYDARYQKINTASKAANGWHKDTNTGVITQWGITTSTAGSQPITFPIAFPNAVTSITTTAWTNGVQGAMEHAVSAKSTTGATLNANQPFNIMWMAKGY